MSFEKKLNLYADLLVKSGLNVQKGQTVVITASIESFQLVREVAKIAYEVGAKEVVVDYNDEVITRLKYLNVDAEEFKTVPKWFEHFRNDYARENACFLYIEDSDPESLVGVEPVKLSNRIIATHTQCKEYFDLMNNMTNSWCIAGGSALKWANKVYPDMSDDEAKEALWNAIFKAAKIDENQDPNVTWQKHRESFEKRVKYLNELNLDQVTYTNSLGTNITIGLNNDYLFAGGGSYLNNGVYNFANIPTEEIFTTPNRSRVDGIVYSALPLNYNGSIIDEFFIEFKEGRAINYGAKVGYDVLKELIETDEGSHYLGEIALIPYDSPINNMKTLFYSTLYDENASCHFALGRGFSECIKDGVKYNEEELLKLGVNNSAVHCDFMLGTEDLNIEGTTKDGQTITIFKDGNFAF